MFSFSGCKCVSAEVQSVHVRQLLVVDIEEKGRPEDDNAVYNLQKMELEFPCGLAVDTDSQIYLRKYGILWLVTLLLQLPHRMLVNYLVDVQFKPWKRLKFIDEASFMSKDCRRKVILGPKNDPVPYVTTADIVTTIKATGLSSTSDDRPPFAVVLTKETNDQKAFLNTLLDFINMDALKPNDILIMDNASIHKGQATQPLRDLLDTAFQIEVVFLPRYSPELNPVEQAWRSMKCFLRSNRGTDAFEMEVQHAADRITLVNMKQWYYKCLQIPWNMAPNLAGST
ncbi:hypothetical protein Pelo_17516 [Pelomyxa schiedti]|nr:hypothetical protein Pelo_17516 [Pelomyxa schiedti]